MEQGFCLCGCGTPVKSKWVRGHHSRVNNISKRADIKELRRQKMQERHDSGEWQPWNKGVSDERTKANGIAVAATRSRGWKINVGNALRKNRKTFIKENHGMWKGGTSTLIQMLRADYNLYKFWKYPILIRDGFRCKDCNKDGNLNIHHDIERMCDIIEKFIPKDKHDLTYEEKKDIIHRIIQYHVDNQISGISICKPCHKKRHLENKDND